MNLGIFIDRMYAASVGGLLMLAFMDHSYASLAFVCAIGYGYFIATECDCGKTYLSVVFIVCVMVYGLSGFVGL